MLFHAQLFLHFIPSGTPSPANGLKFTIFFVSINAMNIILFTATRAPSLEQPSPGLTRFTVSFLSAWLQELPGDSDVGPRKAACV